MITRRTALTFAAAASAAASLAACGAKASSTTSAAASDSSSAASDSGASASKNPLESVKVTTAFGQEPAIELASTPLNFSGFYSSVVSPGTGAAIKENDIVVTRSSFFSPSTGKVLGSQWKDATFTPFVISENTVGADAVKFFTGTNQGARFLMAGAANNQPVLQVGDVVGIALKRAEGETKTLPDQLPQYTLDDTGAPKLSGKPSARVPTEPIIATKIEGTGAESKTNDTLVMHYRGWDYETGEEFDSSWSRGEPFSFKLGAGEVISGWEKALINKKQGSQVLMVLPPSEAYGAATDSTNKLAGKTLIFVADVLYVASPTA